MHVDRSQFQLAKKKVGKDKKSAMASGNKKSYSSNGSLVSESGGGDGNAVSEADVELAIISAAESGGE